VGVVSLLVSTMLTKQAMAYGAVTHQQAVNMGWQAMRAALAPALAQEVWPGGAPTGVPDYTDPGTCALSASDPDNICKEQVSASEWQAYLADMRLLRPAINALPAAVRDQGSNSANCGSATGASTTQVGAYPDPITHAHMPEADGACAADATFARPGVFAKFQVPDDGTNNQGLVLGWHSLDRDNDKDETSIDWLPVWFTEMGVVMQQTSSAAEAAAAAILVPFVCLYALFAGEDDCGNDAERIADSLNGFDVIKGNIPGFPHEEASDEGDTLWHFINVRPFGTSNWYDDKQGMFYDEAGPDNVPGALDAAIMLAGDTMFMNLDASNSNGTSRYEITSDETSFDNPSTDRFDWSWQSEPFPHTQMSPVDNFALFGHQEFMDAFIAGEPTLHGLGWVLHAIGDVTVPMHVAATTAWGHRPYEDAANANMRYLTRECRFVGNDPAANQNGDICDDDTQNVEQLQQAHRVLQHGYRWWKFQKTHPDVRDLITTLAEDTYFAAQAKSEIWCDICSDG
jgi:hypothetical protein